MNLRDRTLGLNPTRTGSMWANTRPEPMGVLYERMTWECKDGYVYSLFRGGSVGYKASARATVAWMREEGMAGYLDTYDWDTYNFATLTQEERLRIEKPGIEFFKTQTKEELADRAARDGIQLVPIRTVKDLLENEQLSIREYWTEVYHPELGESIVYPGASIRTSASPWQICRRAPLIGEHNEEVYAELGLTRQQLTALKAGGVI